MAIYHFSAQVISRSQGRSSVGAAAYRVGERLVDERTGVVHDFTQKGDVMGCEILLPLGAPEWMGERSLLWNAVEQAEKRKDAQVCREINIALPVELNYEQNWALAKAFVQKTWVDKGMVADVSFHGGHRGQEEQPHVHVMLTLREVTESGFGQKNRAWNNKALLQDWREQWAAHCNQALARWGWDVSIDHRTLEAQGIDLEPQSKIGSKCAEVKLARLAEHQALAERNGERLLEAPEIALTALTQQQSTFTHQDIARFVHRHSVDAVQFERIYQKVQACAELVFLGWDEEQRKRYTTKGMLALETRMIEQAEGQASRGAHSVTAVHQEAALAERSLSEEQWEAFSHVMKGERDIACVVGFAGTGKSYMLGAAREAWEAEGYRVLGMTLSGIAAENLMGSARIESYTVANRLWRWERDKERLTARDVVVVDEAGMLGSRQMACILDEVAEAGAKLVLVGDPEQLQAIAAGAAFRAIAERVGFVPMSDIRRQRVLWQQQATQDFAMARTREGLLAYERHDNLHAFPSHEAAMAGMVAQWDEVRRACPQQSQIMLAYTRDEVQHLNTEARALRRACDELGEEGVFVTARGERTFAEQDRVYFLRNESRTLQVKNGTLGSIERIKGNVLHIRLDNQGESSSRCVAVNMNEYNDLDHGYAATVYKAQGVTVDRAHVLGSLYFDRHSTYVAMSRHREGVDLYYGREIFAKLGELSRCLGRERAKDVTLDYGRARGLDVFEKKTPAESLTAMGSFSSSLRGASSERLQAAAERLAERQRERTLASLSQAHSPQGPLSLERSQAAAERLTERQQKRALAQDIRALSEKTSFTFSRALQLGDEGILLGGVTLAGQRYGVLQCGEQEAKLIPVEQLTSAYPNKAMWIESHRDVDGQERLKGVQEQVRSQVRARTQEHSQGRSQSRGLDDREMEMDL